MLQAYARPSVEQPFRCFRYRSERLEAAGVVHPRDLHSGERGPNDIGRLVLRLGKELLDQLAEGVDGLLRINMALVLGDRKKTQPPSLPPRALHRLYNILDHAPRFFHILEAASADGEDAGLFVELYTIQARFLSAAAGRFLACGWTRP